MNNTEGLTLGPKGRATAVFVGWLCSAAIAGFYWYGAWKLMLFHNMLGAEADLILFQWFAFFLNVVFAWWLPLCIATGLMLLVLIANFQDPELTGPFDLEGVFIYIFLSGMVIISLWLRAKIPFRIGFPGHRKPPSQNSKTKNG